MKIFLAFLVIFIAHAYCQEVEAVASAEDEALLEELYENYCLDLDVLKEENEDDDAPDQVNGVDLHEFCLSFNYFDEDDEDDSDDGDDESGDVERKRRGFSDFLKKIERNLRPVGKPILEKAAGDLMRTGLGRIGLGKRDVVRELEKRGFRDFLKKVERRLRPIGKPILEEAAGNVIRGGLARIGLGKRDLDREERDFWSDLGWEIKFGKRSLEKRGFSDFLKKIERNLRPVGKPILEKAAGDLMRTGLGRIGLGKRDLNEREKRGFRDFLKKIERNLRPVGKPILEKAAGDLMRTGLGRIGLGK